MKIQKTYALQNIARIVNGRYHGDAGKAQSIRFLLTDSRSLLLPQHTLFFALKSATNDGHRYIAELLQKGVRAFVAEQIPKKLSEAYPDAGFVLVEDTLSALQMLAAHHRTNFHYPVTAITGSNGKTILKEWLSQSLHDLYRVVRNPKSYNSQTGVPLSVWLMTDDYNMGIFEAGISRPGEMERLKKIIRPDIGIFTNIGPAHDEGFLSRDEKIREKLNLFDSCKTLIYCRDHTDVHKEIMGRKYKGDKPVFFTWGKSVDSHVRVIQIQRKDHLTVVTLFYNKNRITLNIPFSDDAHVENALHFVTYLKYLGMSDESVIDKTASLQPVAMRLEMNEGVHNSIIINDSYNSDLHSLAIALDFMESQTQNKTKTLVLSDILQSGIPAPVLYREVASLLDSKKIDRLIGIGPEVSTQASLFRLPAMFYSGTDAFLAQTDFLDFKNQAVLLKGARPFGFERIVNILQQKDHQTILEIDLDALTHNLNVFRSALSPGVKVMGMVKAFSYGSGSVEVGRVLQYHHVDYLAVAYADEGKALRGGGITIPVVVMNPEVQSFDTLFAYQLEPEVYGFPLLKRLAEAVSAGTASGSLSDEHIRTGFPVHIKMDTGMHRLGFLPQELTELVTQLKANPQLRVASVFSHLAASDDAAHDSFTGQQIQVFEEACRSLESQLGYHFLRHICNSAAITRFPEAHFDMVRPGIGLYGVTGDASVQPLLRHVSTFRSVVSQIKQIMRGETIGYGRAGVAHKDMTVAIVPVGYADGLKRQLGNGGGKLIVNGHRAPIVGNINMDMCTVDVTGIPVREGDGVVVFGSELPVTEVAKDMATIPYEVLTSVSQRVKRVYCQG